MGAILNPAMLSLMGTSSTGGLVPGATTNPTGSSFPTTGSSTGNTSTSNVYATQPQTTSASGSTNPYSAGSTTGTAVPGSTSSSSTYVPTGATADLLSAGGISPQAGAGFTGSLQDLVKGFEASGMTRQTASLLAQFLMGGAGYNPQVANALIAQMQPSIQQGTESLMEQFSAEGNRFGSPAAYGLGSYNAQTNADIGSMLSQLYEESVSNYMDVLMGMPSQNNTASTGDILSSVANMGLSSVGNLDTAGTSTGSEQLLNLLAGLGG